MKLSGLDLLKTFFYFQEKHFSSFVKLTEKGFQEKRCLHMNPDKNTIKQINLKKRKKTGEKMFLVFEPSETKVRRIFSNVSFLTV